MSINDTSGVVSSKSSDAVVVNCIERLCIGIRVRGVEEILP